MKEEILSIASDLREGFIGTNEAKEQFLSLFSEHFVDEKNTISIERAKKYARHQHYLGRQGKELIEFEDWAK
jgi:hypothetical protein